MVIFMVGDRMVLSMGRMIITHLGGLIEVTQNGLWVLGLHVASAALRAVQQLRLGVSLPHVVYLDSLDAAQEEQVMGQLAHELVQVGLHLCQSIVCVYVFV